MTDSLPRRELMTYLKQKTGASHVRLESVELFYKTSDPLSGPYYAVEGFLQFEELTIDFSYTHWSPLVV